MKVSEVPHESGFFGICDTKLENDTASDIDEDDLKSLGGDDFKNLGGLLYDSLIMKNTL